MQLSPRQSKKAFYSLSSARLMSMLIQAGLLVWYTSIASVEEVSLTLTWLALAFFVSGVTDLGFGTMITRFGFESGKIQRAILALDTVLTLTLLTLAAGISLIVIMAMPANVSIEIVLIPFLLLAWCLLETIVEAGALVLVSQSKSVLAGTLIFIRRFSGFAIFPVLLVYFSPGLSFSLSLFLGTVLTYIFVPKAFNFRKWASHLPPMREALKFSINSAWGLVRNLEGPLVTALFAPIISSSFLLATRLAAPVGVITNSFGTVIVGSEKIVRSSVIKAIILILISFVALGLSCLEWLSVALLPAATTVIPWMDKQSLQIIGLVLLRYLIAGVLAGIFSSIMIRFGDIQEATKLNRSLNLSGLASLLVVGGILQDIYLALLTSILIGIVQLILTARNVRQKSIRQSGSNQWQV